MATVNAASAGSVIKDTGVSSTVVRRFNEKGFPLWKFQMEYLYQSKNVWIVVDGTVKRTNANATEWYQKNTDAILLIIQSVDEDILEQIMHLNKIDEIWKHLLNIHERASQENVHSLQQKWFKAQMNAGERVAAYVSRITGLAKQLRDIGKAKDDDEIMTKVICGLPPSYDSLTYAWDRSEPDQFVEQITEERDK